jgi:hypothetical protein
MEEQIDEHREEERDELGGFNKYAVVAQSNKRPPCTRIRRSAFMNGKDET